MSRDERTEKETGPGGKDGGEERVRNTSEAATRGREEEPRYLKGDKGLTLLSYSTVFSRKTLGPAVHVDLLRPVKPAQTFSLGQRPTALTAAELNG